MYPYPMENVKRHMLTSNVMDAAHSLVQDQLFGTHYLRTCVLQCAGTSLKHTLRLIISRLLLMSSFSTPFILLYFYLFTYLLLISSTSMSF